MTLRPRALLAVLSCVAALLGASAGSAGPAAADGTMLIGGTIDGSDGRAVDALIGLDLKDASGQVIAGSGCVRSDTCPVSTYGVIVRINGTLPAEGSADTSTATIEWAASIPANTANVYIEVYPKNPQGVTSEARYGHAMRHNIRVPTDAPIDLHLPLVCSQGGATGSISGNATKNGAPLPLKRVVAWSTDPFSDTNRPTLGWNIGTANSDGTYVVPNLASSAGGLAQRYQVWTTSTEGEVHKDVGVLVAACNDTFESVSFDPPPPPATPTATIAPPVPPPPTVENGSSLIIAGSSATLSGAADVGATVELMAYSRPYTDYLPVRRTTATSTGSYSFSVSPRTNTRLYVRVNGGDSGSVVIGVRPALSLRAVRTATRAFVLTGRAAPGREGQLVSVFARTPGGDRFLGRGASDGNGIWRVTHRFTVNGTFALYAATSADLTSAAGRSAAVLTAVR